MSTQHTTCVESWKDIPGYEGLYQVSDHGNIKSLARSVPMSDGRTYRVKERLLKPSWNGRYFHCVLSRSGKEELMLVHRAVLLAFAGICPDGQQCRHMDGDSKNNHVSNLQWGTPKQNRDDRVRHGTLRNKPPKILDHQVRFVRLLYETACLDAHTARYIAKRYKMSAVYIQRVARRAMRQDVPDIE